MEPIGYPDARERFIYFGLVFAGTFVAVAGGLTVLLLALLLSYSVMQRLQESRIGRLRAKGTLGFAFLLSIALLLTLLFLAAINAFLDHSDRLGALVQHVRLILETFRARLPLNLAVYLPAPSEVAGLMAKGVGSHAGEIGAWGIGTLRHMGYLLLGLLIGVLMSLDGRWSIPKSQSGRRSRGLLIQCQQLRSCFSRIAHAQVRIALINTGFTTVYLMVALPLAGIQLPFAKTIILVTFVGGMIPIFGNLISNSLILLLSLSISLTLSLVSLGFLLSIHKLEYFINARIMGTRIHARAWEMLLAMVVLERILGLAGVVMAPILYAWLKEEWSFFDSAGFRS